MDNSTISNRLPVLAAEIMSEHDKATRAGQAFVQHALEAGNRLIEAKALVAHGEWQNWLTANVPDVSMRTAQRYMRAAENAGKNDNVSFPTLRGLIASTSRRTPEPDWVEIDRRWNEDLTAPFSDWDFQLRKSHFIGLGCFQQKLCHQAKMPEQPKALIFLRYALDEPAALKVCDPVRLIDALRAVMPYLKGTAEPWRIDTAGMTMQLALDAPAILLSEMRAIGRSILAEIDRWDTITPDDYEREFQSFKDECTRLNQKADARVAVYRRAHERLEEMKAIGEPLPRNLYDLDAMALSAIASAPASDELEQILGKS